MSVSIKTGRHFLLNITIMEFYSSGEIFLDDDRNNCSVDNLMLIDNRENLKINRSNLRFKQAELTEIGVTVTKLKVAARRRKIIRQRIENKIFVFFKPF